MEGDRAHPMTHHECADPINEQIQSWIQILGPVRVVGLGRQALPGGVGHGEQAFEGLSWPWLIPAGPLCFLAAMP